ncbi:hypothetical protein AK830_g10445 [Neonectria ditissima]|uniref:NAD-dependent epimerase/dehydratase domain-containing protein n=1 Tax=Neonectria ditissima TaxID=78410 RepID=A0A0P7AFT1_9HYPO|nr:hypothetical protein AK830_g10445 [Neonectria ditissima]
MATSSAAVIGSTGLVGSSILSTLLALDTYNTVNTITRRAPKAASARLNALVDTDTTKWAVALADLKPTPATVFSALGTTAAAAGGIANQWKIDHDLNVELAKAAKAAGTRSYVFVSSGGTRSWFASRSPYARMKNGVEDAIKELDFEHAIILKPGLIMGQREESRAAEGFAQTAVNLLGSVSAGLKNKLGQESEVIAKAAVRAAQLADEGKAPSKYWIITADEIIKLGQTEWPGKDAVAPPVAPEVAQAGTQ